MSEVNSGTNTTPNQQNNITNSFELSPPEAVPAVPKEQASGNVKLSDSEKALLDDLVNDFVTQVVSHDVHDPIFKNCVARIHNIGTADIERAASVSNRMLERPVAALKNGIGGSFNVGSSLLTLRQTVEDLDPSKSGDLFGVRKLFGIIPFGSKLRAYFDRYQSAQAHINEIINSLKRGKDELIRDNAVLETERTNLWALMKQLEKYIIIGKKLDAELSAQADQLAINDPEKAKLIREEMVFYTRQKVVDLLTQQSVNIQSYLSFDLIRKNNLELIKGVERATTTTVSALRTAVIVAQALGNSKLVLNQIQALNETTSNMIESTSKMLREDTATIHQQATSSTIDLSKLQTAFNNIYATLDAIDSYKAQALDSMSKTVEVLQDGVNKSNQYLDRVRQQSSSQQEQTNPSQILL